MLEICNSSRHEGPWTHVTVWRFFCCLLCGSTELKNLEEIASGAKKPSLKVLSKSNETKTEQNLEKQMKKMKKSSNPLVQEFDETLKVDSLGM